MLIGVLMQHKAINAPWKVPLSSNCIKYAGSPAQLRPLAQSERR